jgi:hypothetical protein
VGDVDGEDVLVVATEAWPPGDDIGRDDVRVPFVHASESREVDIGTWCAGCDVKARRVVFAFGRDGAVSCRLPFEDPAVIEEIECERHFLFVTLQYRHANVRSPDN